MEMKRRTSAMPPEGLNAYYMRLSYLHAYYMRSSCSMQGEKSAWFWRVCAYALGGDSQGQCMQDPERAWLYARRGAGYRVDRPPSDLLVKKYCQAESKRWP